MQTYGKNPFFFSRYRGLNFEFSAILLLFFQKIGQMKNAVSFELVIPFQLFFFKFQFVSTFSFKILHMFRHKVEIRFCC